MILCFVFSDITALFHNISTFYMGSLQLEKNTYFWSCRLVPSTERNYSELQVIKNFASGEYNIKHKHFGKNFLFYTITTLTLLPLQNIYKSINLLVVDSHNKWENSIDVLVYKISSFFRLVNKLKSYLWWIKVKF